MVDKINASIIGFVIGDALGVPVEFMDRNNLKKNPVKDMLEYGTHNVPKGTWSDDTSMLLATMDSIGECSNIDYNDIMNKFQSWVRYAQYTATNNVFDIGIATRKALLNYNSGVEPLSCGLKGYYDNGNGSLMRILPIAFYSYYNKLSFEDDLEIVNNVSSLTHAHEVSRFGCKIYCDYVKNLLNGDDKFSALKNLPIEKYKEKYSNETFNIYSKILNGNVLILSEEQIKSTGFVVDSLEAVIWSIFNTKTYEDAVLKVVNLGDDTDTIAALTGALAGIIYGMDEIPVKWQNVLKRKDYIEEITNKFTSQLQNIPSVIQHR